ncbi:MAG: hypothetical protein ACR2QF_03145 [Geminicoccaceae bacterium]
MNTGERSVIGWDLARPGSDMTTYTVRNGDRIIYMGPDLGYAEEIAKQRSAQSRRDRFRVIEGGNM